MKPFVTLLLVLRHDWCIAHTSRNFRAELQLTKSTNSMDKR